jgi:cyclohexadieny/prephenate dehydrogenase
VQRTFETIAILGLGLIGSSIARAVRASGSNARLKAYDQDSAVREQVARLNLVDDMCESASQAAAGSDLVVLCVPVGAIEGLAKSMSGSLAPQAVVMDVGSSKALVGCALRRHLPDATIVPAHPIAGSHRSGPAAGSAELFQDRWCILTPDENTSPSDVEAVSAFWQSLGAKVEVMPARQHDLVVAAISHVPHLLAFSSVAAVAALEEQHGHPFIKYAAGGFRDFTRLAAADPIVWKDIFLSNKPAIAEVSALFRSMSEALERLIADGDEDALLGTLRRVQEMRLGLESHHSGGPQ